MNYYVNKFLNLLSPTLTYPWLNR